MALNLISKNQLITRKIFEEELTAGCSYVLVIWARKPKVPISIPVTGYVQRWALHSNQLVNV